MTETQSTKFDTVKLVLAVVVLCTGIAGFYYFSGESLLYRVLGVLAGVVLALLLVSITAVGRSIIGFAKDSRVEVRKVVWPTRQETIQTTLVVLVMVTLIGIMLWLIDFVLMKGVQLLTGQG